MQSIWKKSSKMEISDGIFFHCDLDVRYIEQEAAEIAFSEAATLWFLITYLS